MDEIKHLRNTVGTSADGMVQKTLRARRQDLILPSGDALAPVVKAIINHGRWIVSCPFCPGAELADPENHRFYCLSCTNEVVEHKWLPVEWPAERLFIEATLLARPLDETRNWYAHETVLDLERENERIKNPPVVIERPGPVWSGR